jgi:GT2 family glycosyltransferase
MDLAIVLVNWNGRELLPTALSSLPEEAEIWVVDNGSSDDSVNYLQEEWPKVEVILNEENLGFGPANNQALRQINKKYVLMFNTDAVLQEGGLEIVLKHMEENLDVALTGARLLNLDGSLQNSITEEVDLMSECVNRNLMALFRGEKRKSLEKPGEVKGVVGAAMLGRMTSLKEIDFFDEDYFFFFEETDLCCRLREKSFRIMHHPEFVVSHAQGKSAKKNRLASRIEYHRSRELFFFKHFGRPMAKKLQLWQARRLKLTHFGNQLLRLLSLGWHKPRKHELTKGLLEWYRLGCPSDQGLSAPRKDII